MTAPAPKPCPFCGKQCVAMNMAYMAGDPDDWQVFCNGDGKEAKTHRTECGYEGPYGDTETQAVERHNLLCRPNPETQAAESKVAKVLRESIERVRPTVLAEREGETITGEVMNMILKGSECPCCYGKGRIPEEAPNATVAYLIGLTRSPVESVPVAALVKLEVEWCNIAGAILNRDRDDPLRRREARAFKECADRLSAIVKEYSK